MIAVTYILLYLQWIVIYYDSVTKVATKLCEGGQSSDIILEKKMTKCVFKHADRIKPMFVVFVASDKFANGEV